MGACCHSQKTSGTVKPCPMDLSSTNLHIRELISVDITPDGTRNEMMKIFDFFVENFVFVSQKSLETFSPRAGLRRENLILHFHQNLDSILKFGQILKLNLEYALVVAELGEKNQMLLHGL